VKRLIALALATLPLAGCATTARIDAGADVHRFLVAVRDNDRATFNEHVDRPAIARQVETLLMREALQRTSPGGQRSVAAIGSVLAPAIAQVGADLFVQPSIFRAAASSMGYTPDRPIPGTLQLAGMLKPAGRGQVCAERKDRCVLYFAREDGVWRLVGFDPSLVSLDR